MVALIWFFWVGSVVAQISHGYISGAGVWKETDGEAIEGWSFRRLFVRGVRDIAAGRSGAWAGSVVVSGLPPYSLLPFRYSLSRE
jgi:hypothetical protein